MASRKHFLRQAAALSAGAIVAPSLHNSVFAYFKNRIAPSDQINIGVIGINGMGWPFCTAIIAGATTTAPPGPVVMIPAV